MSAPDQTDRLNWLDPDAVKACLDEIDKYSTDILALAEDQTDPPGERTYGRAGARALIDEAAGSLASRIAYARKGLP